MKFKQIKAGDLVLVKVSACPAFDVFRPISFWVLKQVDRVTTAQFVVNSRKYWKKDGGEVGRHLSYAYRVGDRRMDSELTDQSAEYDQFILDQEVLRKAGEAVELLSKKLCSQKDLKTANAIIELSENILGS